MIRVTETYKPGNLELGRAPNLGKGKYDIQESLVEYIYSFFRSRGPILLFLTGIAYSYPAMGQKAVSPDIPSIDTAVYDFLDYAKNHIGQAAALAPFFQKLTLLEAGKTHRISIVHIGDSHIQADLWSGRLRSLLQERFGNAGRGLVFPFTLARSNCPLDLNFTSNTPWVARKSVFRREGPPLGISGISIQSEGRAPTVEIKLQDRYHYGQDYRFDRVTVFHTADETLQPWLPEARAPSAYVTAGNGRHQVESGDTLYDLARRYGCSVADLQRWNGLTDSRIDIGRRLIVSSSAVPPPAPVELPPGVEKEPLSAQCTRYRLPEPLSRLTLARPGEKTTGATLFGLILEKSNQPGILYHSIGVNGVTYYHFNRAEYFSAQLPVLRPDLIIVSLGTNEALATSTEESKFRGEVQKLLATLRKVSPEAALLLTTNPDVLRRKRYDNPANLMVRKVILEVAAEAQLGYWDLHSLMGGRGAVKNWREAGLAHTDFIHFTKEGYWLQARLLYQALMKAYDGNY